MDYTANNYSSFYEFLLLEYKKIFKIDEEKMLIFIRNNFSIFEIIQKNVLSLDDDFTETYVAPYNPMQNIPKENEKIDTTSREGVEKLTVVREVLKKKAKTDAGYKCALEEINDCKYFTSKEENKNYLEIHHLIPREFSYQFEDTIEFVENYIPLCPHCHRMVHNALDRERKGLINYLFKKCENALKKRNIKISKKDLYKFYKIDDE